MDTELLNGKKEKGRIKEPISFGQGLITLLCLIALCGTVYLCHQVRKPICTKSKQAEAKANLGGIFTSEEAYRAEHGTYGAMDVIGWEPRGFTRYAYTIPYVSSTQFTAQAQGNLDTDATLDTWQINETRTLNHPSNDCED
jgi:hypothetical protein